MSRIGNRHLVIPDGVTVTVNGNNVTVKGPKGELSMVVSNLIKVEVSDGKVLTTRPNDEKTTKQLHGTTNALINNMIKGVTDGYTVGLEAVGVGYRFNVSGKKIGITAGFSHPVEVMVPEYLEVKQESNTEITLSGINKEKLNQFAAEIREKRPPEPYKGKGIKYVDEVIRRKEGKTGKK